MTAARKPSKRASKKRSTILAKAVREPTRKSAPVAGISFIASPVPTPRKTRPGLRHASVATACATIDG